MNESPPADRPSSFLARRFPWISPELNEGIRFWERGRLAYNGAQLLLTVILFLKRWPESRYLYTPHLHTYFAYAIIANILYTTAYIPEAFLQTPNLRSSARPIRWIVLITGTAFACYLASLVLNYDVLRDPSND
jgi:hypothetical protein